MSKSIHPVEILEISSDEHLVFLAWPIRWTSDWRKAAIDIIESELPDRNLVFASPDRKGWIKSFTSWKEDFFKRQRNWEQYYLRLAIQKGVVMFWLPGQDIPLEEDGWIQKKSYWAITHVELWQLMVAHPDRMTVGIHGNYKERSTLINDLQQLSYLDLRVPYDHNKLSDFPVWSTLSDTCIRTALLLKSFADR
ncbi:MAG: hypothetical protein ACD_2C00097G0003 [uncultured bacterium (gcode 4)]|uniref:Uncharacterized protein n=1 Tax=uncultured bacterium (gcode 4) TaxID=1234023 RepID=K2H1Q7_9BACT|nr:MAG: hypothetical protein ACD_2C00097G0003 [uncultured bacterium (gcode 4)]